MESTNKYDRKSFLCLCGVVVEEEIMLKLQFLQQLIYMISYKWYRYKPNLLFLLHHSQLSIWANCGKNYNKSYNSSIFQSKVKIRESDDKKANLSV